VPPPNDANDQGGHHRGDHQQRKQQTETAVVGAGQRIEDA
jgi:hypothetical protein